MIGKILGNRYEITEKLGVGGMAVVYKAHDSLLQRPVTVKVLRSEFSADEEFVTRFHREARAIASLSHPNIVNVYDVGQEAEVHYLVMEYVDGENLKTMLKREGSLTLPRVVAITRQVCDALDHAHGHGIVHRDIKPHNILITKAGQAKLADFGIALESTAATLVQTKSLIGSVHYISPEQARGDTTNAQSDIYALGIVLYELLTGKVPFNGGNPVSVALKHIQDELPPIERNLAVPRKLEQVVRRATAKIPADRYASAREMARELNALRVAGDDEETVSSSTMVYEPIRPSRYHLSNGALVGIILAVVGLGIGGFIGLWTYIVAVPEVIVPQVVSLSLAEAQEALEKVGLGYSVSEEYSPEEPGTVIEQDVEPDARVKEQRVIYLTVSRGPEMIRVPDVIGETLAGARSSLEAAGFKIEGYPQEVIDGLSPPGTVVKTDPGPTVKHAEGSGVKLFVSKEPEPVLVTMPNLIGLDESLARAKIAEAGLLADPDMQKAGSGDYFTGQVITQDPQGGSEVKEHSAVRLTISKGPGPEARSAKVYNTMPKDGKAHELQIKISDAQGEREAYTGKHDSGERVIQKVKYYGPAKISSYIDGNLVNQEDVE